MLSERVVRFQFCSSCSEDQNLVSCLFFFLLFFVVFCFYMKIENMNYSLLVYLIRHVEDSFGQLVHGPVNKQNKFSLLAVKYSKSEHTDYVNYTHQTICLYLSLHFEGINQVFAPPAPTI